MRVCGSVSFSVTLALAAIYAGPQRHAHAQKVYWAQSFGDRIRRANLNGSNPQTLIEPPIAFDPVALRIDRANGKLYWAETFENTIRRANLDGTGMETVLQPPSSFDPLAIDVDSVNFPSKVYWAQSSDDHILRANLDGTGVQTLVQPPESFDVTAIAVNPVEGVLYWAENPGDRIRKANLDGSSVQTFLDVIFVSDPVALAVDAPCGHVFWAERSGHRIRRASTDGLNVTTILDSVFVTDPVALAFVSDWPTCAGGTIYWAEGAGDRIRKASGLGGSVATVVEFPVVFDPVSLDVDPSTVPSLPPRPNPDAIPNDTTRYLSLSVPPDISGKPPLAQPTALRIRLLDLQNPVPPNLPGHPPPDFSAFETGPTCTDPGGCARWVGKPALTKESEELSGLGTFWASRLQCMPFYFDWSTIGVFHVTGAEVVPSSAYDVANLGLECTNVESTCTRVSTPLRINTPRNADVVAPYSPPSLTAQPDGLDIAALVNRFRAAPGSPKKVQAQLHPNALEPHANIDGLDIAQGVDAFRQLAYSFSGPCPCPSTVTCGLIACSSTAPCAVLGAGSTCVQVCGGGVNDGVPCLLDAHCPGGVCGPGFCRDRCARCTPP